jgi:hypothetical protein
MITIRLKGGLGNQMFQYAAGRALALENRTGLRLDVSYFDFKLPGITKRAYGLDVFNVKAEIVKTSFFRFILEKIFSKKKEEYFQSPKYFQEHEDTLRQDFTLKEPLSDTSKILQEEIKNGNSVGVHVRRGDYATNSFNLLMSADYYSKGIEYISQKTNIEKIYVFSDDISWCKENLNFIYPTVFVENVYSGRHGEGHMMLMMECKNFIIANSSFSWWAAWLGTNPQKIIVAPKQWFKNDIMSTADLIPEGWTRI